MSVLPAELWISALVSGASLKQQTAQLHLQANQFLGSVPDETCAYITRAISSTAS